MGAGDSDLGPQLEQQELLPTEASPQFLPPTPPLLFQSLPPLIKVEEPSLEGGTSKGPVSQCSCAPLTPVLGSSEAVS